jgi:hypothetical protein
VRRILVVLAAIAAVGALLYWATVSQAGARCEACMSFHGRQRCATAAAATRDDAQRAAITAACAPLSGGVTDTIQCEATDPVSLRCSGG